MMSDANPRDRGSERAGLASEWEKVARAFFPEKRIVWTNCKIAATNGSSLSNNRWMWHLNKTVANGMPCLNSEFYLFLTRSQPVCARRFIEDTAVFGMHNVCAPAYFILSIRLIWFSENRLKRDAVPNSIWFIFHEMIPTFACSQSSNEHHRRATQWWCGLRRQCREWKQHHCLGSVCIVKANGFIWDLKRSVYLWITK